MQTKIKSQPKNTNQNARRFAANFEDAAATDWTPLYAALQSAAEWALDHAASFADAYPEELAAVRRVRSFARSRALGVVARIAPEDLAYTFALVFAANTGDLRPLDAAWRWLGRPAFAPYEADDTDGADAGRTARRARSTARLRVA
ncbi:MAG: hypothetical protein JNL83_17915 [Myxococcales bacterium]|nr:hypothetical protein [Myxococcales bacterium]